MLIASSDWQEITESFHVGPSTLYMPQGNFSFTGDNFCLCFKGLTVPYFLSMEGL
jgi:hypothetical protein